MNEIKVSVKSIIEILDNNSLNIPDYQRPYKWERRHIRNLFYDIRESICKNIREYRIGSIILHRKNDTTLDIVDGQQRLISISLLLYYINKSALPSGSSHILSAKNYIQISRNHAKENYDEWSLLCSLIKPEEVEAINTYVRENCKVFVITIPENSLSEAFQLFDSQNNRGRALEPHDLLKAYHLREIKDPKENMIEKWESFVNNENLKLRDLFDKHLFRIRQWANGNNGLHKKKYGSELRFSERFIDEFKGVELESGNYPYLKLYKKLQECNIEFPNSLVMPIINGQAFFKFIEYSYSLFEKGIEPYIIERAKEILKSSKSNYSRNINLYFNIMALFVDRFGIDEIDKEVSEKLFVWAFYPRIESSLVYDSTIANYAGNGYFRKENKYQKMFQILTISSTPREFVANINTDVLDSLTVDTIIR